MIEVTRVFGLDFAHRIDGHYGKCRVLHGHTYEIEATFQATELNRLGMVEDFSVIKQKLGVWLDENWDHGTVLYSGDPIAVLWSKPLKGLLSDHKIFLLDDHPTAENLALYLLHIVCPSLFQDIIGLKATKIVVWETRNCCAVATLES